jgi:hypothetical protein
MLDVVYPLKVQPNNEELRYSLRSLVNLPHRKVWFIGHKPRWTRRAQYVPNVQEGTKYDNARGNILAACREPGLTDDFVLMHDDFFIMRPIASVPVYHRGSLQEALDRWAIKGKYWQKMKATLELLQAEGVANPLFYEMHTPCVFNKQRLLEIAERFPGTDYMIRTVYQNLNGGGGEEIPDVKLFKIGETIPDREFLSTSDAFGQLPRFKAFMHSRFPIMGYYELRPIP